MDTATHLAERRPLLWDAPVAFVLWSLEEAKVRIAERRYQAGETIYYRGEADRYLYFLTKGVIKIYKSYGGHKEAIVTLLEEGNVFGVPDLRARSAHRDSAQAVVWSRIAAVDKVAFGEPRKGEVAIEMRLTHLMLAEMSACSRVGVSMEMARFRREGVIKTRGKSQIVLLDQPRLAQITANK